MRSKPRRSFVSRLGILGVVAALAFAVYKVVGSRRSSGPSQPASTPWPVADTNGSTPTPQELADDAVMTGTQTPF